MTRPWEDDDQRSAYVRDLVHQIPSECVRGTPAGHPTPRSTIPRVIVRFWHDLQDIPSDVCECLDSWNVLKNEGFDLVLFGDGAARRFIVRTFGPLFSRAYDLCHHPAMRCDYFRLCYILAHGGCYIDADDVYQGSSCEPLFCDARLKIQPLCYDAATGNMVSPDIFLRQRKSSQGWTFYVNNNPLVAPAGHPMLNLALQRATRLLIRGGQRLDIQSTTGPGNLTACLVRHAIARRQLPRELDFSILDNWEALALSRWPLSYRSDERNWRFAGGPSAFT